MRMKIRAYGAPVPPPPPAPKEPELEFYLEDTAHSVNLKVRDVANGIEDAGFIFSISKKTGQISRHYSVNSKFELPLDKDGRVLLAGETQ